MRADLVTKGLGRELKVQGHLRGEMHPLQVNPQGLRAAPRGALLEGLYYKCCN